MHLFENKYNVPLLPPEFAAMLGTALELLLPVLLVLGLAGRFSAFARFAFTIIGHLLPQFECGGYA